MNKAVHWFLPGVVLCAVAGVGFALHADDGAAGAANVAGTSSPTATFDVKDEPILSKEELRRIVAFLTTLTGEYGGTPL